MLGVAALALLLPLVASYDLAVGLNSYGRKIFEEDRRANPAIWRQKENITVEAPDNEVIAKVLVIDMRPEKDGDAQIVDGGENQKSVTIELKSPTALRGYDFHIEVYAAPAGQTETESTDIPSEDTDLPTNESPTVKCATEGAIETEEPTQTESADTIREARNLVMENNHESNDTEINTAQKTDAINEKAATESDLTTQSDVSTTSMPDAQSTLSNVPDFPLTGMEGDETRHVRKIGDDVFTSTVDTLDASDVDSTAAPNAFIDDDITTTESDISTTQQSDETFTVPPNTSNGKDIPDFDDLLSTDGEESRFVRHVSGEIDTTTATGSDISTTENVEATTLADTFGNSENETRNSREAASDPINDATETTEMPQTNDEGNQVPPMLQILGNGEYNNPTTVGTDEEENVTGSSGDFTTDVNDTTMPPDAAATTPVTNDSFMEEQIRMGRGIMEENDTSAANDSVPNYPLFIDPGVLSKPNASDDYVYVPILAVISKQSYPAFRDALDNISMNVAFPSNNLDTNTAVEQQIGFEMPDSSDNYNKPIVSLT
ncbi:uncharacterized protein PB18E9.04c-like [Aricia agestis]|uniref:uncharacterized protein PB18E9.04c-like n=1 Tax=Aricia agestis TaxID=91739 RepID=UPI001C20A14B|nr:uncharacterized protein PB18E9.04c-like [Aricia agestis]